MRGGYQPSEWGRRRLSESLPQLLARFRRIELQGAVPEEAIGESWLGVERTANGVRFVESAYDESTAGRLAAIDQGFSVYEMTLREVFLALARSYRMYGEEV